jgi:hypothetical protein
MSFYQRARIANSIRADPRTVREKGTVPASSRIGSKYCKYCSERRLSGPQAAQNTQDSSSDNSTTRHHRWLAATPAIDCAGCNGAAALSAEPRGRGLPVVVQFDSLPRRTVRPGGQVHVFGQRVRAKIAAQPKNGPDPGQTEPLPGCRRFDAPARVDDDSENPDRIAGAHFYRRPSESLLRHVWKL